MTTKRARGRPEKGERPALTARQQADRQRRYAANQRPHRAERAESAVEPEKRAYDARLESRALAEALHYPVRGNSGALHRAAHGKRR